MKTLRRTKIITTLGPASDDPKELEKLLLAGADIVRVNFSHGTTEEQIKRIRDARECAKKCGKEIGILADLQGPKIRIARFKDGKVQLQPGAQFILDASMSTDEGDETMVGLHYKDLPRDVSSGDKLLLDDGRIVVKVVSVEGSKIVTDVEVGGELSDHKGINRLGGGLSAKALTDKDKDDLKTAVSCEVDYIAISFPRSADDVNEARKLIEAAGSKAGLISKIERKEAVDNLDEIILASDAVMVARGDLGVEIGDAELPEVQKRIIRKARWLNRSVITATQMMESMITNSLPTRAEVFDVANAVLDGTDAVMLSAETAMGAHPDKVTEAVDRICLGAEKHPRMQSSKHRVETRFEAVDEAIAMATMYTANHLDIKAIICLTESGYTPLWMSRIRSGIPIYGLSRNVQTQRKMTLFRGVYPLEFDLTKLSRDQINRKAVEVLLEKSLVDEGDLVILTKGDLVGVHGGTNAMKILRVGEVV